MDEFLYSVCVTAQKAKRTNNLPMVKSKTETKVKIRRAKREVTA